MMVREGIWSNTIALVNVALSGLVAYGLYSPLAIWVDEATDGIYTYFLDFLMIWAIFCVSMILLRLASEALSKTRVRLKNPIDPIGGPVMGLLAAWVLTGFAIATMHTAPLAKDALGGGLVHEEVDVDGSLSMFSAPDLAWLSFVERTTPPAGYGGSGFSADAFIKLYADHRAKLEKAPGLKVRRAAAR